MARTYEDVIGPLRAADDDASKAHLAVFERAYVLAAQVAALREKRGLTQQQLAELAGIDQADVSKIERGVLHPSSRRLHRLAEALGADIALVEKAAS